MAQQRLRKPVMNDDRSMREYTEKRDFIRLQVNASIQLNIPATGETLTAVCKDLSGTGMLLKLERPLDLGTEVQTVLPSNSPELPAFKTTARVVRHDQVDGACLVGLEIVKIE